MLLQEDAAEFQEDVAEWLPVEQQSNGYYPGPPVADASPIDKRISRIAVI